MLTVQFSFFTEDIEQEIPAVILMVVIFVLFFKWGGGGGGGGCVWYIVLPTFLSHFYCKILRNVSRKFSQLLSAPATCTLLIFELHARKPQRLCLC